MQLYQNESEQKININKLKYTNWLFDNNLEVIQAFQEKGEEIINAIYHTQSIDKNSSLEENVGIFYDIGSRQNPGYINENELKSILVSNLVKLDEQKTAKILSNELYQLIQPRNQAKGISKSELIYVAKIEPGIEHIIMKNTRTIKSGHSREYVTPKQYLVFEQAVKHEGIFFAEDKQLMSALNAKEQGYDVIKSVKNDLFAIKQMNKQEGIKFQQNSENSDDEDTEIDDENFKKQQKNKSQNN
ncbi:hypothetical protein PPERSA_09203 [Pseudocohnilembus persalinus]|uniref:Uncharacterized protein n=1 Tax=Pseudocohnilembus persalinus TaxID=266149 RepID=A0A0V0QLV4_PSEPJ|nr:hypothetical protein PPERSA_09203 [Pseudocohnilembus persalinus]|eukprot:KRX03295.1 hypothetical protein PPERSA_09203 [Pseudocohnilembus persalinus]